MALKFIFSSSSFFNVLLCLLCLPIGSPQNIPLSEGNLEGQQVVPTQSGKENDDYVALQSPVYASEQFIVRVEYKTKAARIVSLDVYSYGHDLTEKKEFQFNFFAPLQTDNTHIRKIRVSLRDSLVFRDNKALNILTDLHTVHLKIVVSLLSLESLSLQGDADVFASTINIVMLVPPWRRSDKPGFCFTCFHDYLQKAEDFRINKCRRVRDVVTFVGFPVALAGKEEGFKKKLYPINWNDDYLNEIQKTAKPRFTITTWIYVIEPCIKGLCSIFQHRSNDFLTPLVSLVPAGKFHIQLHFKDGSAQAFLTKGGIHRNTWNMVVLTFNHMAITVTVKHGPNLQYHEQFEFHDFPKGPYHIDDSDGYWVIGGTHGFSSFKGFLGPTTFYRGRALSASQVPITSSNHAMFKLELENYFSACSNVVNGLTMKMEDLLIDKRMNDSLALMDSCQAKPMNYFDLFSNKRQTTCDVTFAGESPETDDTIVDLLKNDSNVTTVGEQIFVIASKMLKKSHHNSALVTSLLRVSGCTGHTKALYTAGVMFATGLGVPQDLDKAWQFFLVGAMLDHPLSQMSLAYRFLIGGDGFQKHCDIAAGYYKMAASTTDKVIQAHHRVHTHSEAVRLDDYDEVASHKGKDSDIFHWLAHQALQGIGDAQGILGDMYWYGKKGFDRDLNEALKFYKMNADLGKPEGLFNLGISKLKGQGTEKNETEAFELISKAAEQEFPPALNALGFIEVNFRSNYSGAVMYFKRAAAKGDRDGLNNLGIAMDNGWDNEGIASNKAKAIEYWQKAAGKGHPGACVATAEAMRAGYHIQQDCVSAVVLLRFVAEQHPEIGWLLRDGFQSYNKQQLYKALVSYLLAGETGMEVPQYNAALLCEENENDLDHVTAVDCMMRYYNNSAAMGWVFSMIKVGDSFWYGKKVSHNLKSAARMYAEAASKNDHPHAVYNLAYMVEFNYSLDGIQWKNVDKNSILRGNLTFAAVLYQRCRDSNENNNESYLPCAFGLVRVLVKNIYRNHTLHLRVLATVSTIMTVMFSLWLVKIGDRME